MRPKTLTPEVTLTLEARLLLKAGQALLRARPGKGSRTKCREALWEAADGKCLACGGSLKSRFRFPNHPESDTIDHVFPQGWRGLDQPGNYALMHQRCNGEKGSRPPNLGEVIGLHEINQRLGWPTPPELSLDKEW